jgi:ribosomal protein S18 acetylase RimI-like enzyme
MDIDTMRRQAETPSEAAAGDIESVVADLTDAFEVDPHFNWFMRDDARRTAARTKFFRLLLSELAFGIGRIDRPAVGGAAAVWLPSSALGPNSLVQELRALPVILEATGFSRFGRMLALRADMDKRHPMDRAHSYLWFLGVTPQAQGHGVGSRLLKAGTDRLDAAGTPAYLETGTERNVALYTRHGFKIISKASARPDAPPMWGMWRDPGA